MQENHQHAILPETFKAELTARLKPADWYLVNEVLDERAKKVEKGNWITGTLDDAELLGHNDPETLRGIAFIARVIAEWTDDDEEIWADPLHLTKVSSEDRTDIRRSPGPAGSPCTSPGYFDAGNPRMPGFDPTFASPPHLLASIAKPGDRLGLQLALHSLRSAGTRRARRRTVSRNQPIPLASQYPPYFHLL